MSMFKQEICPIEGRHINRNWFVDYAGKRIYFCSPDAPKKFMQDPDKYMEQFSEKGVELEDSPQPHREHSVHRKGEEPEPDGEYHKHFEKHHTTGKSKSKQNKPKMKIKG